MAITREPEQTEKEINNKALEKKLQDFINGGGTPTKKGLSEEPEVVTKSIKLILTANEMETIKKLRDKREAPRSRKISISVHDWVIEAIQEKIERETRKYERL